jgi:hypothetical protein
MNEVACLFALAYLAASAWAQDRSGQVQSGYASFGQGIMVHYVTTVEPPLGAFQKLGAGGIATAKDRVHRYMVDGTTHQYFGYDLVAEPAESGSFRVSIEPLTLAPERMASGPLYPAPLPKYPPPQIVQDGDTIALDLMVSPNGRQKVVDYIVIAAKRNPGPVTGTCESRDFTLDDGPLDFQFESPVRFFINGHEHEGELGLTKMRVGGTLWFDVPGKGRYILSLAPREGFNFVNGGVIGDHVLTFQSDGDRYEFRASAPIVVRGGTWNVYVLHDPLHKPKPGRENAVSGGTDRLENLVSKP